MRDMVSGVVRIGESEFAASVPMTEHVDGTLAACVHVPHDFLERCWQPGASVHFLSDDPRDRVSPGMWSVAGLRGDWTDATSTSGVPCVFFVEGGE